MNLIDLTGLTEDFPSCDQPGPRGTCQFPDLDGDIPFGGSDHGGSVFNPLPPHNNRGSKIYKSGRDRNYDSGSPAEDDHSSCQKPAISISAKQGYYGEFKTRVTKVLGLDVGIDLGSIVTAPSGARYFSRGVSLAVDIYRVRIGISLRGDTSGGNGFESAPSNFLLWDFVASTDGLDYEFSPPQAISGFSVVAENLEDSANLVIPCAF